MSTTAWAHLPNAKHIDRILADLIANPDKWSTSWNAERYAAWEGAWDAANNTITSNIRKDVWDAWNAARAVALGAAWDAALDALYGSILALIAYDDCAYLLDEKPEDVLMLGLLGNNAAILLYPAYIALQKEMA